MSHELLNRALRDFPILDIPESGVYFFADRNEWTKIGSQYGRVVRIGTHGAQYWTLLDKALN